jgi:hypothetical protein
MTEHDEGEYLGEEVHIEFVNQRRRRLNSIGDGR